MEIQISILHIKEVEMLFNLIAKYKGELPKELVEQLLRIEELTLKE